MLTEKTQELAAELTGEKMAEKVPGKIAEKRRALGRGLESLLPGSFAGSGRVVAAGGLEPGVVDIIHAQAAPKPGQEVLQLGLEDISPNPFQTRSHIDENYLAQLAASIATHGVLQPVTVRPGEDGKYVLIAGECRWKASKLAEKKTIPAIVRVVSDQQALELTIIENLQRQDLNCMDQAQAFQRLSDEFRLKQEDIAVRTGTNRSTVSNYLRLMRLPSPIQESLREGELTFGHAKALMSIPSEGTMILMAERVVDGKMSVRRLEEWVLSVGAPDRDPTKPGEKPRIDPNVRQAEVEMERALGLRVRIRDVKGKGSILLQYRNLEDFDRVVGMLSGK